MQETELKVQLQPFPPTLDAASALGRETDVVTGPLLAPAPLFETVIEYSPTPPGPNCWGEFVMATCQAGGGPLEELLLVHSKAGAWIVQKEPPLTQILEGLRAGRIRAVTDHWDLPW